MTFFKAQSQCSARRLGIIRSGGLGIAIALVTFGAYAGSVPVVTAGVADAGSVSQSPADKAVISSVDFKRGENGSGRLVLRFNDSGVAPDLRNQGANVVVDIANVTLPTNWRQLQNVTDFATPVQRIDARSYGGGTQLILATKGEYESLAYQTGNEYVVEIIPRNERIAVGAVSGNAVDNARAQLAGQPRYSGRPVTFNFQDVPVRTVLQLIAEESNLNVVASDTVQGNVTLRLVNVPWDQALDIVLRAKGLDKRRSDNVIWVAPQAELARYEQDVEDARIKLENSAELITDYVQINYHNAAAIYKALTEAKGIGGGSGGSGGSSGGGTGVTDNGFLSPRGRLVADERTNTLMISDIPKKVAQMRELISVIDRPVDQVLIEGRIVIATDTFARDLGVRFGVFGQKQFGDNQAIFGNTLNNNHNNAFGPNVNLPAAGNVTSGASVPSLAYTLLGNNFSLDLELSALQEEGRGEVISNPRIVTANQREGVIKQGKEIGYVTITGGNTGAATANVQFKEVLLELRVTPTITNDGRVFLNMNLKKDEVDQWITLDGYGSVPSINRREINTAVLIEDGQTVVIGGVYEFTDSSSVSKVPFLGDVPFLGNLFKKRGSTRNKAELLVFVTPKVLQVAGGTAGRGTVTPSAVGR
ncbi:MAG: type IV pilus secretin PilQ family protein [Xanthomonadaceae bacterium]|jgi:type IV pilus assembly protein PilQ|nr:type IV pilus secretin PilQ family protein [Xanthomonadaceae bacterium]